MVEAITNNWEMCEACGCTNNNEWDNFCSECGFEIEYDDED